MFGKSMRMVRKWTEKLSFRIYITILIVTVLLNGLAWSSTAFCDMYIAYVFPVWVNTYGRIMGIFPFSVGEWLLAAGMLLVLIAMALALVWITALAFRVTRVTKSVFFKRFFLFFGWVVPVVCLIMTLNCFILYHATAFSEKYFGTDTGEYTAKDLLRLRNFVAAQCNHLSEKMDRDDRGRIHYGGSLSLDGRVVDMEDKARETMRQLGKTYPQLDGYYPRPKALLSSDFMCRQNMLGWYFPFSMEANYNKTAYVMNRPASMCHELAHLRGYIFEDEATFISYLACVQSDDAVFQYSGYLSVLGYLERDLRKLAESNADSLAEACETEGLTELASIVYEDDIFVTTEEWERINQKALIDTETVEKATDAFVDTTLKVNGVADGKISYSRVVRLLLQYYAQNGY